MEERKVSADADGSSWEELLKKYQESFEKELEKASFDETPELEREEQSIAERTKNRKAELENESFEQDMQLKKTTLLVLFGFLAIETVAIFVMAFFQGFEWHGFKLEEWSFRILTGATITQITVMLLVAVRHLFPQKTVR